MRRPKGGTGEIQSVEAQVEAGPTPVDYLCHSDLRGGQTKREARTHVDGELVRLRG